jgi:hypothetical protein
MYLIDQSLLISFTYLNRSKEGFARTVPRCGGGGGGGGRHRRQRWRSVECGIDGGGGDRQRREWWRLRK